MKAGVPLARAQAMRECHEAERDFIVPDNRALRDFIPIIQQFEATTVKEERGNLYLHAMFDGTTRNGELFVITARWCNSDFVLQNRVLHVTTAETSVNATSLAALITDGLVHKCGIDPARVVGFSRDSVSVNGSAVAFVRSLFKNSCDILCISHTLNNSGERITNDNLTKFTKNWLVMSSSSNANKAWKKLTTKSLKSYSNTRWWSKVRRAVCLRSSIMHD